MSKFLFKYCYVFFLYMILSAPTYGQLGKKQQRFTLLGSGDSITEGGENFSSYLYPLWEKLFTGGYLVDFIGPKQQRCRIGELSHAGYNHFIEEAPVPGMIAAYQSVIKNRIKYLYGTDPDDSLEDAKDAIYWLRANAGNLGIDRKRIIASGASAGGYLAAAMGVEPVKEKTCYRPDLLVLNYPVLDRIKETGTKTPPILFLVGSEDPLVSLSTVEQLKKEIQARNGVFEFHVFEKAGHPIFYYRKDLDERFYEARRFTDAFLIKHGYLEN